MPIVKYYTAQVCLAQGIAVLCFWSDLNEKKFVDIYQSNFGTILAHSAFTVFLCNLNCIHIDANIFRGHFTIWGGWVDRGGVRPNHCTNENARETRADLKQCKIHSVPF